MIPLHRLQPRWDSQREQSTDDAPVCETKQRKLEYALQWVSTSQ